MDFSKVTKSQLAILIFAILYTVIFAFFYLKRENYEFLIYVGTLVFFIIVIGLLHFKYHFTTGVLLGMGIWGLMHMAGGGLIINGDILYVYNIFGFLRFDKFVHMWGFGFATLLSYYILKPYLSDKKIGWLAISFLLILIGMGIGALNEIIEFVAVLALPKTGVGGYDNTMWDIVFNTIGAIIAVVYINVKRKIINKNTVNL